MYITLENPIEIQALKSFVTAAPPIQNNSENI